MSSSILVAACLATGTRSFAPSHRRPAHRASSASLRARRLPADDREKGSGDPDAKPPWLENAEYWARREELERRNAGELRGGNPRNKIPAPGIGDRVGRRPVDRRPWSEDRDCNDGGNTFAHLYNPKSTDEFKLPFEEQQDIVKRMEVVNNSKARPLEPTRRDVTPQGGVPEWFGSTTRSVNGLPAVNADAGASTKQPKGTNNNNVLSNPYEEGTDRRSFQTSSTDDFRKPYGMPDRNDAVPEWFGSNTRQMNYPAVNVNIDQSAPRQLKSANTADTNPYKEGSERHSFQMSTTDDFRKPYGTPSNQAQSSPRAERHVFKSPFQTSATDDFRRSSDVATGIGSPQQEIYATKTKANAINNKRNDAWKNSVGQDAYESTMLPSMKPLGGKVSDEKVYATNPSRSSALLAVDDTTTNAVSKRGEPGMLLRSPNWTDPPTEREYPSLLARMAAVTLATLSTRYLHLRNGFSPVLASSVVAFLISTCFDGRLGRCALCGALAGMSGGHLVPNLSAALMLGGLASGCYEVLIRMSNLCAGIGGRVGASAFLATGILAKYRHVSGTGRKLRRGMWKAGVGPSSIVVSMIAFHIVGAVVTILLRECSENDGAADPVRASSVVGLLGALFLRDPTSLMALYGGSFVGMSLPSRLICGNARIRGQQTAASFITSFAGAGAIAGLIHASTMHYGYWNGGWGGKVGLCAFMGCWVYRGFDGVFRSVQKSA